MCKDQLCVKHAKFLSSFLSINHQCTKKHKARVFIVLIVKNLGGGGGSWRVLGGGTLTIYVHSIAWKRFPA